MNRVAFAFVVVLALLLQGMAQARTTLSPGAIDDLGHAALHWQQEGHHHHDDGSYHLDDSADSARHLAADQLLSALAAAPAALFVMPRPAAARPAARAGPALAPPFLEGPLRPPRSAA